MPWFKIDDGFWSHPKVLELSDSAVALWVRAGAYCAGHLTDGSVTRATLRVLAADRDAAIELVLAGLWDETSTGWSFHDWDEYQPTRDQVLAERAAATERKRASRERSRQASQRDAGGTHGGSHSPPSRPVPTRPDPPDLVGQSSRDGLTDESYEGIISAMGVDPGRLRAHIKEKTGRVVSAQEAMNVASAILARGENVAKPQAYVLGAITRAPGEVREQLDQARPTSSPRRESECAEHPHYPLPCDKCAQIASEGALAA